MLSHLHKATGIMKNQENMTPPKEHNTFSVNAPKQMEIQEFPDKKIQINYSMDTQRDIREHNKQLNEIRETIQEQKEKFHKDIENIKNTYTNRNFEAEEHNEKTEEFNRDQREESVILKTDYLKLSSQGSKEKKEWKGMKKANGIQRQPLLELFYLSLESQGVKREVMGRKLI